MPRGDAAGVRWRADAQAKSAELQPLSRVQLSVPRDETLRFLAGCVRNRVEGTRAVNRSDSPPAVDRGVATRPLWPSPASP